MLRTIPDDSLAFHAQQNQFSIWLMGRGEIDIATKMNPIQLSDFKSIDELRLKIYKYLKNISEPKSVERY